MKKFSVINNRPIIGVAVVMSDKEKMGTYSLNTSYIKNIESSGARCVPIFPNESEEYYRRLFKKLNGLFVPGGYGAPMDFQKPITEMVKLFYDWSIQAYNDKEHPTYWPIWGTCLGFEIIACVAAGMVNCLDRCQFCSGSHCIEFRPGYEQTRMIKALPNDLVQMISVEPLLPHLHSFCLPTEKFTEFNLDQIFRMIGTNRDKAGLEYVTAIEAFDYPIYAVMSHQEKAIFQWVSPNKYNQSRQAIRLGQALMNFFVEECSKNDHHFESIKEENAAIIQNYTATFTAPLGYMTDECYYFQ